MESTGRPRGHPRRPPAPDTAPFSAASLEGLGGRALRDLYFQRYGVTTAKTNLDYLRSALTRTYSGDPAPV